MAISRRDAICGISGAGATVAGVSLGVLPPDVLYAQAAQTPPAQEPWPDRLVERPLRQGFPAPLPLNPDGSAPEHPESAAGPITDPLMWRTPNRQTPAIEFDYRKMTIKLDTRGLARLTGTLRFEDLEKLPRVSHTFLLQCGAPNPRGIVKWTGVRFNDFADILGLVPGAHYCRLIASDRHYVDEPMTTLRHRQVMLAWLMNDQPISPRHGAPLRLVIPFRYGNRSIKAITEIIFSTPGLPALPLPA
ncbi:MAG TPA: molybdopterin-dependent oxidoreductase [Vicinamibacterales bacterium]|nr:molybdopterin-dependent oxidoreductase [Vicinamibacterales bacterium]